jgi:uncharacterized integral membrane protein
MSVQETRPARKPVSVRTVLLVILAVVATVFAVKNWQGVSVWPLGTSTPLAAVIGIAFVLGGLIGWLAHSLAADRRAKQ